MEADLKKTLSEGGFFGVDRTRSRMMSAVRGRNNHSTELRFRMALVRSAVRGWVLQATLPGKPDFYFPSAKVVLFLDGCFWHGCRRCGHIPKTNSTFWRLKIQRNRWRDRKNTRALRSRGFKVLRIWEHSLRKRDDLDCMLRKLSTLVSTIGIK